MGPVEGLVRACSSLSNLFFGGSHRLLASSFVQVFDVCGFPS